MIKTTPIVTRIPNENFNSYFHSGARVGQSVPNWRQKIKEARSASSPYSLDASRVLEAIPMNYVHNYKYTWGPEGHQYSPYSQLFTGYRSNLYSRMPIGALGGPTKEDEAEVLNRIYNKIRSESSSVNGLLVLGELRETINMLRNPLSAARKATSYYLNALKSMRKEVTRKVKFRKSDTVKTFSQRRHHAVKEGMSGSWLELQFGILPAISDAKDILEEIAMHSVNPWTHKRSKVSAISTPRFAYFEDFNSQNQWIYDTMYMSSMMSRKSTSSIRYDVGLQKRVDGPWNEAHSMRQRLGFEIQNFVPTIYELIPWSFLIDYFVNLGDIVSAVTTDTSDVFFITSTTNIETTIRVTEQMLPRSTGAGQGYYQTIDMTGYGNSSRVIKHRSIVRTVHDKLPVPQLVFSIPGMDSTKWVNMGALLAQARSFKF